VVVQQCEKYVPKRRSLHRSICHVRGHSRTLYAVMASDLICAEKETLAVHGMMH